MPACCWSASSPCSATFGGVVDPPGPVAEPLVAALAEALRDRGVLVPTGEFGADMRVHLVGDGPLTVVLDTP